MTLLSSPLCSREHGGSRQRACGSDGDETFDYYDVDGATAQRSAPTLIGADRRDRHRRFDAVTHWYVRWRYTYKNVGGGCGITTV